MHTAVNNRHDKFSNYSIDDHEIKNWQALASTPPHRPLAQDVTDHPTSSISHHLLNKFKQAGGISHFLDSLSEFVYFKDRENLNIIVNRAVADSLGTTPERMAGTSTEQWYPQHASQYHTDDKEVIDSGKPKRNIIEPIIDANGLHRHFRTDKFPLRDENENIFGVLVVAQEIQPDDSLYQKLNRASLLEVLGLLAAGSAHNFKNLLWVAQTQLAVAKTLLPKTHPTRDSLLAVDQALEHCSDLANRLLDLGRSDVGDCRAVHLEDLISDSVTLLSNIMPNNIELKRNFSNDVPMVYANPLQISEVILNLVLNARDALPNGGTITLSTSRTGSDGDRPGSSVMSVSDTGPGIDAKIIPRLFLPYNTTKSGGFGIGLASSKSIATDHGGDITVDQTQAGETRFNLSLPSLTRANE